jgi:hypothetical protein
MDDVELRGYHLQQMDLLFWWLSISIDAYMLAHGQLLCSIWHHPQVRTRADTQINHA